MTDISVLAQQHKLKGEPQDPLLYLLGHCGRDSDTHVQLQDVPTLWAAAAKLNADAPGDALTALMRRWHVAEREYPEALVSLTPDADEAELLKLPLHEVAAAMALRQGAPAFSGRHPGEALQKAIVSGFYNVAGGILQRPECPPAQELLESFIQGYGWGTILRCPAFLQRALERGLDPNTPGPKGNTALFAATTPAAVKLLVAAGASVNHQNEAGRTALEQWIYLKLANAAQLRTALGKKANAELDTENLVFEALRQGKAQSLALAVRGEPQALARTQMRGGIELNALDIAAEGLILRFQRGAQQVGSALLEKVLDFQSWPLSSVYLLNAALAKPKQSFRCESNPAFSRMYDKARRALMDGGMAAGLLEEAARKMGQFNYASNLIEAAGYFEKVVPTSMTEEENRRFACIMHENALRLLPERGENMHQAQQGKHGYGLLSYIERCARFNSLLLSDEEKWQRVILGVIGAFGEGHHWARTNSAQTRVWAQELQKMQHTPLSSWAIEQLPLVQSLVRSSFGATPDARQIAEQALQHLALEASVKPGSTPGKVRL